MLKNKLAFFCLIVLVSCTTPNEPIKTNKDWLSGVWYFVDSPSRCCPKYCTVKGDSVFLDYESSYWGVDSNRYKTIKGKIISEDYLNNSFKIDLTPFSKYYENGILIPNQEKIKSTADIVFENQFKFKISIFHSVPALNIDSTYNYKFEDVYVK